MDENNIQNSSVANDSNTQTTPQIAATLPGPIELLLQAWKMFTKQWLALSLTAAVPVLIGVLLFSIFGLTTVLTSSGKGGVALGLLSLVGLIVSFIVMFVLFLMQQVAMIDMAHNNRGIRGIFESYKIGFHRFLPMLWISLIAGFMVLGSAVFLIVPGIFFAVAGMFAVYIFFFTGEKGVGAIVKSWQLVSGRWWKVFGRFLVFLIAILLVYLILGFIVGLLGEGSILGGLLSVVLDYLLMPAFTVLYMVNFYMALSTSSVIVEPGSKRGWVVGFAVFGLIVPFLGIVLSAILASLNNARGTALDLYNQNMVQNEQMMQQLELEMRQIEQQQIQ